MITKKWKTGVTALQKSNFNILQNATILRENSIGFVDLKIAIPGDVMQSVQHYINSGLVEVARLVEQMQIAGRYQVAFDASNLASGVYIYVLRIGNFLVRRHMILIK